MQFFLLSLILIYLYYKIPKFMSWIILFILVFVSTLVRGLIAKEHHYTYSLFSEASWQGKQMQYIYVKPYCRWIPYFVGLFCGFIYLQYKKREFKDKIAEKTVMVLTMMKYPAFFMFGTGIGILSIMIYIDYLWGNDREGDFKYFSQTGN